MVFSSNEFLFFYLPLSLILYFLVPPRLKNLTLFAVSLIFYGWERPSYLAIMLLVVASTFVFGNRIEKSRGDAKKQKRLTCLGVAFNVLVLCFFKYTDFLLENLAKIEPLSFISPIGIGLPIGISFYVFQSISYIVDVYRQNAAAQRSFVNFGTYISLFPQLIAGPIVRYSDVEEKLNEREHTLAGCANGARRFVVGLAKKVLFADLAGEIWEGINAIPTGEESVLLLWLGILFYTFQIYFDFSGYSDMAIGLGKILGFDFPENFNYPYISKSITEFWRRWHITLSTWFKEYVYLPLGGSRRGGARVFFNLLVVWLLTGLWHGASWNFVLWGFYYFVLLIFEKFVLRGALEKLPNVAKHLYVMFFVALGWLIFYFKDAAGGIAALWTHFLGMFGARGIPLYNGEFIFTLKENLIFIIFLALASTPYPRELFWKVKNRISGQNEAGAFALVADTLLACLFVICIAYISSSEYRPNIYFEF